jgi:hypothetical protein
MPCGKPAIQSRHAALFTVVTLQTLVCFLSPGANSVGEVRHDPGANEAELPHQRQMLPQSNIWLLGT